MRELQTCEFLGPPGIGKSTIFASIAPVRGIEWHDHFAWQDGLGIAVRDGDYREHFRNIEVTGGVVVVRLDAETLRERHIERHRLNPKRSLRPDVAVRLLTVCDEAIEIMKSRGVRYVVLDGAKPVKVNAKRAMAFAQSL